MSDSEEFIEAIKASIMYGVSNPATIIIYGVLYILMIGVFSVSFIVAILFYKSWIAWVLFGLTCLLLLAISWLSVGYFIQCLRGILRGDGKMPGLFDDVPGLAIESVKGLIVSFLMLVPVLGLCLVSAGLMIAGILALNTLLLFVSIVPLVIAMVIAFPLGVIYNIQLVVYADTGSLRRGLNPLESIGLIRRNVGEAVMAAGQAIVLYAVYMGITMVLSWTCIGYLLMPFAIVPMAGAILYIVARFYRRAAGMAAAPPSEPAA